jgi:hypothetical protein
LENAMRLKMSIVGVLVGLISAGGFAQTVCSARTPQQTLPAGWVASASDSSPENSSDFYRLARIVVDPELHVRWAMIANCTHPEWPLQMVAVVPGQQVTLARSALPAISLSSKPSAVRRHVSSPVVMQRAIDSPVVVNPPMTAPNPPAPKPFQVSPPNPAATLPLVRAGDVVRLWSSDANVRLEMEVVSLEYGRAGQVIHLRRVGQTTLLAGVVVGQDSAELLP